MGQRGRVQIPVFPENEETEDEVIEKTLRYNLKIAEKKGTRREFKREKSLGPLRETKIAKT
jgi:hypothetical protein